MYDADGAVRPQYKTYSDWLKDKPLDFIKQKQREADTLFTRLGITFAVYGDEGGVGRSIPFDIIPRILRMEAWKTISDGASQRVRALNLFLKDIYHDQDIIKAGIIPAEQILNNAQFRPEMMGVTVPHNVYSNISGIDIVRAPDAHGNGEYYVLEDNLRVPSGVSYMLENRKMMMRLFPDLFSDHRVAPVAHYPDLLLETLRSVAPGGVNDPTVVVLTPGAYVVCAVTNTKIPLEALRYWSVDLQEAYAGPGAALKRLQEKGLTPK